MIAINPANIRNSGAARGICCNCIHNDRVMRYNQKGACKQANYTQFHHDLGQSIFLPGSHPLDLATIAGTGRCRTQPFAKKPRLVIGVIYRSCAADD